MPNYPKGFTNPPLPARRHGKYIVDGTKIVRFFEIFFGDLLGSSASEYPPSDNGEFRLASAGNAGNRVVVRAERCGRKEERNAVYGRGDPEAEGYGEPRYVLF